ncbi:hypothetical protein LTR36_006708 [Oleoguttula mirabilis]|uniref:Asl1-like glycosyl hydrolase catalytic domain-containing protein n=1 Tax=Oleoguttula mirabilis TaxID=1507867 RepID=A0AAV9JBF3_9PEZI|nr:hypothetical protein LTR36_006708 [Oleoguttula mirabilis]
MQYTLVLAAAALAHAHEHGHGRFHGKRSTVTDTVVEDVYVTVTEYVTAAATSSASSLTVDLKNHWHSWSSPAAASSSSEASSAPASTSVSSVSTPSSSWTSSSAYVSPVAYSSSSSAATTLATSTSVYSSSSAYSAPSSVASSSSAYSASSAVASSTGITVNNLTPNGKKAGLSGYSGVQNIDGFSDLAPYISWYSDYLPNTPDEQGVKGIGMLWGASGSACTNVSTERVDTFDTMIADTIPEIMFGFYEPDCTCDMSSEMSVSDAAAAWESLIAPLKQSGTVLGSPSMCKQKDEDFLTPFNSSVTTTWDVTAIHINKPNVTEAIKDVGYYHWKYGKPIWVTEFACVDDENGFTACTDQDQINSFINDCVSFFEGNGSVVAYGPSNGEGLGDVWPLFDSSTGELSASGTTYLNAIKGL